MANVLVGQSIVLPCIALTRATFLPDEATACVAGVQLDLSSHASHGYWWDDTAVAWAAAVPANADLPAATLIAGTDGARNITLPASAGAGMLGGRVNVMFVRDAIATPLLMGAAFGSAYFTSENSGARAITLQIRDAGANAVPGATVDIYNDSDVWLRRIEDSDLDGDVIAYLDDGTYHFLASATYYTQDAQPQTVVVTADASVAVPGVLWAVPAPSDPSMCVVYGNLSDIIGTDAEGAILSIAASTVGTAQGIVLTGTAQTDTADATGYVSIEVLREASVVVSIPLAGWQNVPLTVPAAASQDLATWTA